MRDDACYHIRTAPGQSVCTCLDELMWLRLLVELQARRIAQLEEHAQHRAPRVLTIGDATDLWQFHDDLDRDVRSSRPTAASGASRALP